MYHGLVDLDRDSINLLGFIYIYVYIYVLVFFANFGIGFKIAPLDQESESLDIYLSKK